MRAWIPVLFVASAAVAGPALDLHFKDGRKVTATVSAHDAETVTLGTGATQRKVRWAELRPESAFRARRALTPYDDGPARLRLSEFAAAHRLFPQALEELEVTLALGGLTEDQFERRARALREAEVEALSEKIESCLEKGEEPAVTLDAIKALRKRYPDHPINRIYEPLVKQLVGKLEKSARSLQEAERRIEDAAAVADLKQHLAPVRRKVDRALAKAAELKEKGLQAAARDVVSGTRKKLVDERIGAVAWFKKARTSLRKLAKLDRGFRVLDREALRKEYDRIEKDLVDCYLTAARVYLGQRNYKRAALYVYKVLLYDPIHEEALEMKEEIGRNRIRFKASDITNARPRQTGG
ncbi:MAG: hypothetical protein ACE5JG_07600 [Planctomycetota bacterium]